MKKNQPCMVRSIAIITTFLATTTMWTVSQAPAPTVTLTGRVSCGTCALLEPQHKGYTRWTWAVHSVREGDSIVLVVGNETYKLEGEKDQLLKHMEDKVTITGNLDGRTLAVQSIAPATKTGSRISRLFFG
jgi:hypothetical protein